MKCELLRAVGTWRDVADCANTTVGKEDGTKEPSTNWKRKMLLAEHSPIRKIWFDFKLTDLKYWVSVHLVRHKIGIEHFVSTQRTDRTGEDRDKLPQDSLVMHRMTINMQAMINISRKRLCKSASPDTMDAWKAVLETIKNIEPELYAACVPECIYRGKCHEFKSCGYDKSKEYHNRLIEYGTV